MMDKFLILLKFNKKDAGVSFISGDASPCVLVLQCISSTARLVKT